MNTPLIKGLMFVGGVLFLILGIESLKKDDESTSEEKEPSGSFSQEEIRRLRRELRHQMKLKKTSNNGNPTS